MLKERLILAKSNGKADLANATIVTDKVQHALGSGARADRAWKDVETEKRERKRG